MVGIDENWVAFYLELKAMDDKTEFRFHKLDEATRFLSVGEYTMKSKRMGKGLYWWTVEDSDGKLITYSRRYGASAAKSHTEAQINGVEPFMALIHERYNFTQKKITFCK